jgi:hypothetical protein
LALAALLAAAFASDVSWAGAPGFNATAVVNKFGTLKKGHGSTSAAHLGRGEYTVTFSIDVTSSVCGAVATVGRATFDGGFNNDASFISVANVTGDSHTLYVETRDKGGHPRDLPFNLMVGC